ncbi:MAG: ATP synthase subunit I [Bryobacteraceae bacterium]
MTAPAEQEIVFYERATRRIFRNIAVIAAVGTLAAAASKGFAAGAGFAAGSAGAWLILFWFHRLASALADGERRRTPAGFVIALGLRYALFGAAAYVMMRYLAVNPVALVAGLTIIAPAVLIEILYELIFARKAWNTNSA